MPHPERQKHEVIQVTANAHRCRVTLACGHKRLKGGTRIYMPPKIGTRIECRECPMIQRFTGNMPLEAECDHSTVKRAFGNVVRLAGIDAGVALLLSYGVQHTAQLIDENEGNGRYFVRACDRFVKAWHYRHNQPSEDDLRAAFAELHNEGGKRALRRVLRLHGVERLEDLNPERYADVLDRVRMAITIEKHRP